jgi:hypothetical protein
MNVPHETGFWLVLTRRGAGLECLVCRTTSRLDAEDLAASLAADSEEARVVPESAED